MKRLQLNKIKTTIDMYGSEIYNIEKCPSNIQGVIIQHVYINGVYNHVIAVLPNGLKYAFFGSYTCDLITELNAFIQGFNEAVMCLE